MRILIQPFTAQGSEVALVAATETGDVMLTVHQGEKVANAQIPACAVELLRDALRVVSEDARRHGHGG